MEYSFYSLFEPPRFRTTKTVKPSTCQNPKAPISVAQGRSRLTTLQHQQLLAETKVLRNQECSWPENCPNGRRQKSEHLSSPPIVARALRPRPARDLLTPNPPRSYFCA